MVVGVERCVGIEELAEFFRVSEGDVVASGLHLTSVLSTGATVVYASDYKVLRGILHRQVPTMVLYDEAKVKSELLGVYKSPLVDSFLAGYPRSVVEEPLTGVVYYWSDQISDEYYDYVLAFQEESKFSVTSVGAEVGLNPSQVYTMVRVFGLPVHFKESKRSGRVYYLPKTSYYTLRSFFDRYVEVSGKPWVSDGTLDGLGVKPIRVKGCGIYVENRVVSYLERKSLKKEIVVEGVDYLSLDAFVSEVYDRYGLKASYLVLDSSKLLSLVALTQNGSYYLPSSYVEKVGYGYIHYGLDCLEGIAYASGYLTEEALSKGLSYRSFEGLFTSLVSAGYLPQSSKKYVAEGSQDAGVSGLGLRFMSRGALVSLVRRRLTGLPFDTGFDNYVNVLKLVEFLNEQGGDFKLPKFIEVIDGGYALGAYAKGADYLVSISYNILLVDKSQLDSVLVGAYESWLVSTLASSMKRVEELVYA